MGLFDGPAIKFAQRFIEHLEARSAQLLDPVYESDNSQKVINKIVAMTLLDISSILKAIIAE